MRILALVFALSSACCWMGGAVAAEDHLLNAQTQSDRGQQGGMSADQAARRAQDQYGGRVLAVRPEGSGFRVKLLKDGEVRTVFVGN
jgi:hypothetical protein